MLANDHFSKAATFESGPHLGGERDRESCDMCHQLAAWAQRAILIERYES